MTIHSRLSLIPRRTASIPQTQTEQAPRPLCAGKGKAMVSNRRGIGGAQIGFLLGNWSSDGRHRDHGVAPGEESVDTIAKRYGVVGLRHQCKANNIAAPRNAAPWPALGHLRARSGTRLQPRLRRAPPRPRRRAPATNAAGNGHVVAALATR